MNLHNPTTLYLEAISNPTAPTVSIKSLLYAPTVSKLTPYFQLFILNASAPVKLFALKVINSTLQLTMTDLNPYNPINSVDTTTYDWNCRVKLQSFWKVVGREKQEFWGINMVLIDDSVCSSNHSFILITVYVNQCIFFLVDNMFC